MLATKKTALWLPFEVDSMDKGVNSFSNTPTGITYTAGLNGKVASFNGTSSCIEILNSASKIQALTTVTFCCWVYFNNVSASQLLFSNRTTDVTKGFTCGLANAKLFFDSGDGNQHRVSTYNSAAAGSWYFVAFRKSSTMADIFFMGTSNGYISTSAANTSEATNMFIGTSVTKDGLWLNGYMKNAQIYDTFISDNNLIRIRSGFHPII